MRSRVTDIFIISLVLAGLIILPAAGSVLAGENPVIDQEIINKAIGSNIEKNMRWPTGSMRYEILTALPAINLPAGKISWKVDLKGNEYLGDAYFVLKLYNRGVLFREEAIRVRIEVLHESVVSAKSLSRDSVIGDNDIMVHRKWVRSIPVNSISSAEEVLGKLLCMNIRSHVEITRNMLKEATAVKRGKMVQVVLDNGAINISTVGLSEEDGAQGALVRVRNVASNKIIYARVIGESRVQVDFK